MPGVQHVIEIDRGIAVVADGFWPAKKGREALEMDWDEGPLGVARQSHAGRGIRELAEKPGAVAKKEGDVGRCAWPAPRKSSRPSTRLPYLAHAPMEPHELRRRRAADSCEVWTGTQFQTADRDAAAEVAGLEARTGATCTRCCSAAASAGAPSPTATSCVKRCRSPRRSRSR